ncbi:MAG: hypothetical protein A3I05_02595 [Deltaproteobacteria bacterium RIFCSPLOWO2_02_FULL_44_10]|nr:MAG: hypothetical protein A3C46_01545 [Deltaproteobacteria bacterium RIFCSPHIGHO2_02_FULL_44_16]OGQ45726.1 MAG: hypothetical protein A3I05_02595 [Deltaproteobacteria bacterium RIFCSPLOWO2_02_FULL_44_10]
MITSFFKTGRNDSCPCGSGKKFKKCCLSKQENIYRQALPPLRKLSKNLDIPLLKRGQHLYGPDFLQSAWLDFWMEDDPPEFDFSEIAQWFMPWVFYHWIPSPETLEEVGPSQELNGPIAADYLEKEGKRLDAASRELIITTLAQPFSLWEVQRVEPGVGVEVKDLLLPDRTFFVREVRGSEGQCRWNTMFAKVVTYQDESIFEGSLIPVFPPIETEKIVKLMKRILKEITGKKSQWNTEDLCDASWIMMRAYLVYAEEKWNTFEMPKMRNTDGEDFVLCKLFYRFDPRQKEKLQTAILNLQGIFDPEDEVDEEGKECITFTWIRKGNKVHKHWENTILGTVSLYLKTLLLETNSRERVKRLRMLLEKECGELIEFQYDSYLEADSEVMKAKLQRMSLTSENSKIQGGNDIPPKIKQQIIRKHLEKHYEQWPDTPLPALQGKTPREAVNSRSGKKEVESIVKMMENRSGDEENDLFYDFNKLRRTLGLQEVE